MVSKEGVAQRDIGGSIKLTYASKGVVSFDSVYAKHKRPIDEFIAEESRMMAYDHVEWMGRYNHAVPDTDKRTKRIEKELRKRQRELLGKLLDAMDENRWYYRTRVCWASFDAYIPFTRSEYLVADSATSPGAISARYMPWNFSLSGTVYWSWPKGHKLFITGGGGLLNNNSVAAEQIDKVSFSTFRSRGGSDSLFTTLSEKDVYIGSFTEFWTPSASVSATLMSPWAPIGFSGALEWLFGDVQALNWKLGIPVSLKAKGKDSRINFELQWRERFNGHTVGLSIGLPFGQLL